MRITKASDLHVAPMADLLTNLFAQEADFAPDRSKQLAALEVIVNDPSCGQILVALDEEDESVLGMVSLLRSISTAEGGLVFWLEDMVVRPDARGRGVGRALLDAATAAAKRLGASRITLLTDASNEAAIRFYNRSGFEKSAMVPLRLHL